MPASISNLPTGWVWIYKGQETWITAQGRPSTERHAKNLLTGHTLSVRQAQNLQKTRREETGVPKKPPVPRAGKTKTGSPISSKEHPDFRAIRIYFTDLPAAIEYYYSHIEEFVETGYKGVMLEVRYETRLVIREGSNKKVRHGFNTLSSGLYEIDGGAEDEMFIEAEERLNDYEVGTWGRVIMYLTSVAY